ncbi:apolipoprotein N-acyltransferase [Micromonospora sp. NBC_01813]|uniref:apolipoprotein N-acyltransferase n=1 Tax=Micromonospora sp. NBC_01813 TaxID=2975988 RepID=UPI002DDC1EFE|nr:apolipoprotein N-acyltransferase [Micromonospora sp. NBC_01813]WSA12532.1 apolipoprotein N-acyltransferase [Micromonospora sp. NBC_01813]
MVDEVRAASGPGSAPVVAAGAAVGLPWAVGLAVLSGAALLVAFPPYGWWWAAPVGVAALAVAVHRRRLRAGAGLGFVAGVVFFAPLLSWTNLHTGSLPWVLLSGLQASYLALLGAVAAFVSPVVDRRRLVAWPLVTGLLWVGQEALRGRTPFGGFPWGRLAFSQGDSPALPWASVGGAPLVTFVVAVCGGVLAAAVWRRWRWGSGLVPAVGGVLVAAGLLAVGALVPLGGGSSGSVTVAIVQGNVPRMGLDFNAQRRAVLDNHVQGTLRLAQRVAAGEVPAPDLVVWPENASDVDPLQDDRAAASIDEAATAIGVPILVGALSYGPAPGEVRNVSLVWEPGSAGEVEQVYVKRHPVPFAEYVPMRRLARMVTKQVDLVRADFVAGSSPGVLRLGPVSVSGIICFEVAYDALVRDTVTGGAQVLAVQTNNATFDVAEAGQQLAMVRLRAVEHGRDGLMASTVGVSAFVDQNGRVSQPTEFNTAAVVVSELELGATRTLATRMGVWPEMVLVVLAGAVVAVAVWLRRRVVGSVTEAR